ncbi:MAG TPA: NAD(P)-binding domain-containing protein [Thermoanaerobaculia bacterium]|nr:NAD(P)-binding domain-containing protein [Thermoanaerobaculia bacterium]
MPRRIVVMGGGPIGIAAAIAAIDRGFDATLIEQQEVGHSLRSWGETRFFSPLSMNVSPRMLELLGSDAPPRDALLTGAEMADRVLVPLASCEPLRNRTRTSTRVLAIGRRGLTRSDYAGHPLRAERPFRLVVENGGGEETIEADFVLDATGGCVVPNPIGSGGLPARGERQLHHRAIRTLGDLDRRRDEFRGRGVLLVGDGHSAANAVVVLSAIEGIRIVWAVRTLNRRPCEEVAEDPLPERQRVVAAANDLAEHPPPFLRVERRAVVESFEQTGGGARVLLSGGREVVCDVVAAFTGFHPGNGIHSELTVEISPVTEGSARLYRAVAGVTDCLSVPRLTIRDLDSGEPNYWMVGSRSYGRSRTFLLQTGLVQVETILDSIRHD